MNVLTLNINQILQLTSDQFYKLCQQNPELKLERNTQGELIIMPPTGGETGSDNAEMSADFVIWNRQTRLGKVFDSSTCFQLPNGSDRSPDVAWIRLDRWNALSTEQKQKFPPIAPDFVLELISPTDSLRNTQNKMQEYMDNGVRLGWLINSKTCRVEIYRLGQPVEVLENPSTLSGEEILPGFVLNLELIWD